MSMNTALVAELEAAERTVKDIRKAIIALPAADSEACFELAEHISRSARIAGPVVGTLAIALVGAETQLVAIASEQKEAK